jgi:hypothetical protein
VITWRGDVLGAKAKIVCVLHNKDTKLLTKAGIEKGMIGMIGIFYAHTNK